MFSQAHREYTNNLHDDTQFLGFAFFAAAAEGVAFRITFFAGFIYGQKGISLHHHFHRRFGVLVLIVSVKLCRNAQHAYIKFTNEIMNYVSTGVDPFFFYSW